MNRSAMLRKFTFISAAMIALAACGPAPIDMSQAPLAGADIGGEFELIDKDGKTVRWSDFDGEYRTVYFGYTYCPDVCPVDVQRLARGIAMFAEEEPELAARIQPIFITIDPKRDTPEVVGQFTGAFSDRMIGLTGTEEQIKQAADTFRVFYARGVGPDEGYLMDHSNITYLFGPDGEPIATLPTDRGAAAVAEELAKWVR